MKKPVALLVLFFSMSSFAAKVSFTYFGNEGNRQSYYSCDYVQVQAEEYLDTFGAKNVEVYCSGGIQPWGSAQPVSVNATFDVPELPASPVDQMVELQG